MFFLPFQYISYVPAMIYTGNTDWGGMQISIWIMLAIQAAYTLLFLILAGTLYHFGNRRFTGVGAWGCVFLRCPAWLFAWRFPRLWPIGRILSLITLVSNFFVPLVTILIYGAGASIPGWMLRSIADSIRFYALHWVLLLLYNMVWVTMGYVKDGAYDLLLIKPCPAIAITMAHSFELGSLGVLLGGLSMFFISLSQLPPPRPLAGCALSFFY